jgi:hypothetical protein
LVLILLAIMVGLASCGPVSSSLQPPGSVTYRVYGQAANDVTIRVVTELEGVRTFGPIPAGPVLWEYQTGYARGRAYHVQVDVSAVTLASGTAAAPSDTDILYDPTAAFTATVQQNDLVRNESLNYLSIVTQVIDDHTLQVGIPLPYKFDAGTLYGVYSRNSLAATMTVHHPNGRETVYANAAEAPELALLVKVDPDLLVSAP